MTPDELGRLRALLARERDDPQSWTGLLEALREARPADDPLWRLLALKDEAHRTEFYVKSEAVWYRRFGFRIMRPLLLLAVAAAAGFLLQRVVDPALGLACFLAGAFGFYVVLQIFAWRWGRADERRLASIRDAYRQRLERLIGELEGREGQR